MSHTEGSGAEARRWAKIQEIFHGAVELDGEGRAAFLVEKCGGDASLRMEVESLLAQDTGAAAFLEQGLPPVANAIFDGTRPSGEPSVEGPFLQSFFNAFGPYRFQRELGRGGMGVVYLAEREGLGGLVAIKVLRDAWVSPARRERFANEQRTLAQLNHDSIARLFDANTLPDGTPWFAMEYVEGVPLTTWCKVQAPTLRDRLLKFREICQAVQYAHGQAVIHRDLKPSNIFVASSGTIKLLDFGIAKQLESIENPADATQTAARLLTPAYAAPEQIRGENVGVQVDVYALGVVLYELLTGRLPFDVAAHAPGNWEKELLESEPDPPSAAVRRHRTAPAGTALASRAEWADLDVLCLRAMQKFTERRYPTVEAMVRDVDHFLAGEPLEARADSLAYRWGKFLRRHRRAVGFGAGLALIAVTGLIVAGTRLRAARDQALTEALKAQRVQRFTMQLFGGGEEELGPAESLRVATLIDRGIRDAGVLHHEPEVQAELFATLGAISREMGNLDRSDSLLSRSLDMRRTLFEPESPEVSESLVSLGLLRLDEARFDEAKALIGEAVQAGDRGLPANHPALAKAHLALAQFLVETGEYDAAIAEAEESIRRLGHGRSEATTELTAATKQLSAAHFYAGRYEIADSLNRVVLDLERRIHGERHPRVAETLINLGASQFDRGHYPEAEDFHRRGLEIIEEYYGPNHPETAYALTMLGRALVFLRKIRRRGPSVAKGSRDSRASLRPKSSASCVHVERTLLRGAPGGTSSRRRSGISPDGGDLSKSLWRKALSHGHRPFQLGKCLGATRQLSRCGSHLSGRSSSIRRGDSRRPCECRHHPDQTRPRALGAEAVPGRTDRNGRRLRNPHETVRSRGEFPARRTRGLGGGSRSARSTPRGATVSGRTRSGPEGKRTRDIGMIVPSPVAQGDAFSRLR